MANEPSTNKPGESSASEFEQGAQEESTSLMGEFWQFLRYNKKWWLTPIILMLIFVAILVATSPTVAPFIYTLF